MSAPTRRRSILSTPRQHFVQVEDLGLDDLLAAEHQQLPGEVRGSRASAADLLDVAAHGIVALQIHHHQLRVAQDDREQVVEVVRDPSRQLAHGFHLLGLPQLPFELPSRGDVVGE